MALHVCLFVCPCLHIVVVCLFIKITVIIRLSCTIFPGVCLFYLNIRMSTVEMILFPKMLYVLTCHICLYQTLSKSVGFPSYVSVSVYLYVCLSNCYLVSISCVSSPTSHTTMTDGLTSLYSPSPCVSLGTGTKSTPQKMPLISYRVTQSYPIYQSLQNICQITQSSDECQACLSKLGLLGHLQMDHFNLLISGIQYCLLQQCIPL